jgi:N-acetylglucosaminyldiphosphoundecaprenol N-acetyl-beta-D-mannosaminyltransferase
MIKILNKIYQKDKKTFYNIIIDKLKRNEKTFIITVNPELMMLSQESEEINSLLLDERIIMTPDGIGIIKGAKIVGTHIEERIPGIEIAEILLNFANEMGKSVYFYGSKQENLNRLEQVLKNKYMKIKVLGLKNGYDDKETEVFLDIKEKNPDILLVALGVPKQELFINKYYNQLNKGICIGVGGSLDVLSGAKKRAPKFLRNLGLEWMYRVISEPKRIKRFYRSNIKYMFAIRKIYKKEVRGLKND